MSSVQKLRPKLFDLLSISFEYVPWTLVDSFRNCLIKQHSLTADYVNEAGDIKRIDLLANQLKELTDCLLFDDEIRLASLKNKLAPNYDEELRNFEFRRTKLIEPLSNLF